MKKFLKWITRNIKVKIWLLFALAGMALACYGFAQVIALEKLEVVDIIKIAATFISGFIVFVLGLIFMQKGILESAVSEERKSKKGTDAKDAGPKVVVIGGGDGLTRVLKGLKTYTNNLTAIVTVSNYGDEAKRKPTDDTRNSLIALAQNEQAMEELLDCQMGNTKFGDIYLSVIEKANKDLALGIEKSNNILAMTGKVLPVTLDEMKICVELEDGTVIEDKEKIEEISSDKATGINRVYIKPTNCRVAPGVIEAIKEADAIVMGPGEIYTSVIPNLLIRNVAKTIRESKAFRIYISNIMTKPGHTDDYSVSEHIKAIVDHAGKDIINYCICDNGDIIPEILRKYINAGSNLVEIDKKNLKGVKLIRADVSCNDREFIRHDSDLTARVIMDLIYNELKFKDKQKNEQFALLSRKLKETKKKVKERRRNIIKKKKPRYKMKSKFSSKYRDRIISIKESQENTDRNRKRFEKKNKVKKGKKAEHNIKPESEKLQKEVENNNEINKMEKENKIEMKDKTVKMEKKPSKGVKKTEKVETTKVVKKPAKTSSTTRKTTSAGKRVNTSQVSVGSKVKRNPTMASKTKKTTATTSAKKKSTTKANK